jgi:hypothetical protein
VPRKKKNSASGRYRIASKRKLVENGRKKKRNDARLNCNVWTKSVNARNKLDPLDLQPVAVLEEVAVAADTSHLPCGTAEVAALVAAAVQIALEVVAAAMVLVALVNLTQAVAATTDEVAEVGHVGFSGLSAHRILLTFLLSLITFQNVHVTAAVVMTAVVSVIAGVMMTAEAAEEAVMAAAVVVPAEVRKTVDGARHLGKLWNDRFGGIKLVSST